MVKKIRENLLTVAVMFGGSGILLGVWFSLTVGGDGTWAFWDWSPESWQAVAAGVTGLLLAVFASLTWSVQSRQRDIQAEQAKVLKQQVELQALQMEILYKPKLYTEVLTPVPERNHRFSDDAFSNETVLGGMPDSFEGEEVMVYPNCHWWDARIINSSALPVSLEGCTVYLGNAQDAGSYRPVTLPRFVVCELGKAVKGWKVARILGNNHLLNPGEDLTVGIQLKRIRQVDEHLPISDDWIRLKFSGTYHAGIEVAERQSMPFQIVSDPFDKLILYS